MRCLTTDLGQVGQGKRPQLFDLSNDPHENNNLAGKHPEFVADLAAKIAAWWPLKERKFITKYNW
jgi:hypothetical protein|tara:strand:- start:710 stop:904 length:195 start_codon:yes stop_codon:yes gene_type:complete